MGSGQKDATGGEKTMKPAKILSFTLGVLQTNCYIIVSGQGNALIIDPADQGEYLLEVLQRNRWKLIKILLTHGHFDHIGAVNFLREQTGAELYVPEQDAAMIHDLYENLGIMFDQYDEQLFRIQTPAEHLVKDKDQVSMDGIILTVCHTPGHTHGSSVYIGEGVLFSGDTLFQGTMGKPGQYTGSLQELLHSLQKLSELDGDYRVLPGHGAETTLSSERAENPYMGKNLYDNYY